MENLFTSTTYISPIQIVNGHWTVFGERWGNMTQDEQNCLRMHINRHRETIN